MKITLDTNVLISGSYWKGDSYRIISLIDEKILDLVISNEIIEEYKETLRSEYILEKVADKKLVMLQAIEKVFKEAILVQPTIQLNVIKDDPDDDRILECALEGNVNYIISRDKHLLKLKSFKGIPILTPTEFLMLEQHK